MPAINYTASDFPASFAAVNGAKTLNVSWPFLVWSAISVGRAELLHLVQYGEYSLLEIVYRAAMLFANVRENGYGQIRRSEAYLGLDPSEKSAISYFLGLTMAKGFAERVLNVPWLMHLDVYREELMPILAGQSRPDLVGRSVNGDWVVIEAKGRSNSFDPVALSSAKAQAQMVVTIGGDEPVLRMGMVTHFGNERLQFRVNDPERDESRARLELPLTRERFDAGYYRPFRTWLSRSERRADVAGRVFRVAEVNNADLTIGLAEVHLQEGTVANLEQQQPVETEHYYAGRDGVLVSLGPMWSTTNMRLEPQTRTRP